MHLGDVGRRRGQPAADRPHRLVGNDQIVCRRPVGYRALKLCSHHRECASVLAFSAGLAHAHDGAKSGAARSEPLRPHIGVGFLVIGAPLGVADDDGASAGILEHLGRNVAGECSIGLRVTILRTQGHGGPLHDASK